MTIKSKLAAAVAALTLATSLVIPTSEANARARWGGVAAGLFGAAIVGATIAEANAGYYDGYRNCRWVRQYNVDGFYVGRARVCNYY